MQFEFATAARIVFGPGSFRQAGAIAKTLGKKALVVQGQSPRFTEPLRALLQNEGIDSVWFGITGEPDIAAVTTGTELSRQTGCDLVISIGGGSAIDGGKAIAAMLANRGVLLDYLEVIGHGKPLLCPSQPFMAIPTTAGTGSEVTRNAVLASAEHRTKVSLRSPHMLPRVAMVDPELTYGLPPSVTAATGLDALTQLIEPFVSNRSNPMTDAFCQEGIRRVARSLLAAATGNSAQTREDLALASLLGGLSLANAGLGAVHGFAGPIGGMFPRAPHGALCAALLPHVMEANIEALSKQPGTNEAVARFDTVAQLLTGSSRASAGEGTAWVKALVQDLRIPGLATYGIQPADFPEIVAKARAASSMKANPVALDTATLNTVLQKAL